MQGKQVTWSDVLASWTPEKRASELREPIVFFVARPLALPIVWAAARLGISPNALSVFSWLINIAALVMLASGVPATMALAPAIAILALVVDCTDGMVARATGRSSKIGEWLDALGAYGLYAWYHLAGAIGAIRATNQGTPVTHWVPDDHSYLLVAAAALAGTAMLFAIVATAKFAELFPAIGKNAVVARRSTGWYAWLFTLGRNLSFPSGFVLPLTSLGVLTRRYDLVLFGYAALNVAILGAVLLRCAVSSRPSAPGKL